MKLWNVFLLQNMIYLNFIQMKINQENRKTTFKMPLWEIGTDTEDW